MRVAPDPFNPIVAPAILIWCGHAQASCDEIGANKSICNRVETIAGMVESPQLAWGDSTQALSDWHLGSGMEVRTIIRASPILVK